MTGYIHVYRGLTDVLVTYMLWLLDAVMLMMQCGVNMTRQERKGQAGKGIDFLIYM